MQQSGGLLLDSGLTESTPYNLSKGQIGIESRHLDPPAFPSNTPAEFRPDGIHSLQFAKSKLAPSLATRTRQPFRQNTR